MRKKKNTRDREEIGHGKRELPAAKETFHSNNAEDDVKQEIVKVAVLSLNLSHKTDNIV